MADGYARASGKVGVCVATSGPGATNLTTGIATAYMDSVPLVAITGQVATHLVGNDAFQEADTTGITRPITKQNYLVTDVRELQDTIAKAFLLARTGRPGPVLIDIPVNIQNETCKFDPHKKNIEIRGYKPTLRGHPKQIRNACDLMLQAKKPILYAGGGIIISDASKELKKLAEKLNVPVTLTLMGIGAFPGDHKLFVGMPGMHGTQTANYAIQNSDLIIAVGVRFDDRVTGRLDKFAPLAKIIHIDIDPAEIGKNVRVDVPIVGDVKTVLKDLNKLIASTDHAAWVQQLNDWRREHPTTEIRECEELLPQFVIRKIYEETRGEAIIVTGVGQNQMFAAHHYWYDKPNSLISSGGLGTMGFELPAAMGVKVGRPDNIVWCIAGDGGFQMTIQELATIAQEGLAVKIAIMNNAYLGMIRQWQEFFYGRRYVASPLASPDFVKVAEAYGIPAQRVKSKAEVVPAIKQAMEYEGPFLVDFIVEPGENVYPMVPPGATVAERLEEPRKVELAKASGKR